MKIVSIVEGHGDCAAVPVLLRRLCAEAGAVVEIPRPIRIPKSKLVKADELRRAMQLAAKHADAGDAILILVDADDDCPARLGPQLLACASRERPDRRVAVVLAQREFEAWFAAAARSLVAAGKLIATTTAPDEPESVADAKGWLARAIGSSYSETVDQPAFAALFDLDEAASRCASFVKLRKEVRAFLTPTGRPHAP